MKFIGQFIQSLVSRFRNDVYLEDVSSGTIASGGNLGLDSNNKIVKANVPAEHNAVTLAGSLDYITLSGQEITRNAIDLAADVTGFLPIANGGTGANNAAGARASLGAAASSHNHSASEITSGTLSEARGGTGVTDVKTIVTRQVFTANFLDDIGTDKHYLPLVDSPNEQTVVYRHEAAIVAPCDGRVASVSIRFENLNTHSGNAEVTVGVEKIATGGSYAGTWSVEETEPVTLPDSADHDTVHFHFNDDKHFDSTDMFAVSIQSDTDITGGSERFWVTVVVEWDWSTYLGTKGTTTIYASTP